jgi:hypothetical protein
VFGFMLDGRDNLRLRRRLRLGESYAAVGRRLLAEAAPDSLRDIRVQRAGMGFFLVKAEFWKNVQDRTRFHLQLARQLVDSDFGHTVEFSGAFGGAPGSKNTPFSEK